MSILVRILVVVFVAAAVPAYGAGSGAGPTGNIVLVGGLKLLDDTDWSPVEEQHELGLVADVMGANWDVSIEVRALRSDSDTKFDPVSGLFVSVETSELDLGIRKHWDNGHHAYPYIAGGVARIDADVNFPPFGTVSDHAYGLWAAGGVYLLVAPHLVVGLDVMVSEAEADFGTSTSASIGGGHAHVLIGYPF